jgi:hypothetical protein
MSIEDIVAALRRELSLVDEAIAAMEALGPGDQEMPGAMVSGAVAEKAAALYSSAN